MVFRHLIRFGPDIVAGQIDVLPTERRQVVKELVGNRLDGAQRSDGAVEVAGIPQNDCGDEEVQAGGSVLLILVGAVADFSEAMDENRTRQTVA